MSTSLIYRKATDNDIDYLLDLRMKTMNPHYETSGLSTDRDTTLQRVLYQFEKADIILLDNQPVGLLKVDRTFTNIEVLQLQIDPSQQGKGLGKKILSDILEEASLAGKTVSLSVLKTNKAQHLYISLGFKITGEDEYSYFMETERQ
ncbi:GNAT family N-acetyltransferase [Chryseobacterium sp. D764]|jgi:ribosomal protein S18 acetylase RimI-like enzyme|uniref:GNAT family N-acetyltransferase n=1 Tax=unclassified Chryseobacterium TaxID=2593645 RepID=UPI000985FC89|nr:MULTISPECIES: GNAT family N-acetyltransferase [unclassified Chryseobacterium]QXU51407.1 GNAT family N-acetyltransferase [Chryseobacterium sp. D764]CAD0220974.1 Histone acetyltransferase HPA2 and related acetyltransferases [Chryseobacterium sp. JV274]